MGDGNRLETGRALSLAGSTPAPSAVAVAERLRHCAVNAGKRVRFPPATLVHLQRCSSAAECPAPTRRTRVQILPPLLHAPTWLEQSGTDRVSRLLLVRFQSSALGFSARHF